jgi:electron transfer flavoprotein-quinone oxidoreductase
MKRYYDVIVVGAGPAGAAAAKVLGDNQVSTLLLERGRFPGAKNVFGGAIYSKPTSELIPAFWKDAPIERIITKEELWFLDQDSAVKMGFTGLKYGKEPYNKISILRPVFDRWFASQATAAGAVLKNSTLVTEILAKKKLMGAKEFHGVRFDDGSEVYGDIIILAEGAINILAQQSGIASKMQPSKFFLYIKEVLSLAPEKIEERFNLEKGQGAIYLMLGYPGLGRVSKIGIFTNSQSLSLIIGGFISHMRQARVSPSAILEKVKQHPLIKPLIDGAERQEYMAHMTPKGGVEASPKYHGNGLMLTGDTATMTSGRRGIDLAMLSGMYAAETAIMARARGDNSETTLSNYSHKLQNSFFIEDMKRSPKMTKYYAKNPDADLLASKTVNRLAYEYFSIGLETDTEKIAKMASIVKDMQHPFKTMGDLYYGLKDWSV